jgi:glycosyltransferase involved in cell wall biosynthesis
MNARACVRDQSKPCMNVHVPRRVLYLSHNGLSEPLGRSQIVPYLRGVARSGWSVDVVAFEPDGSEPTPLAADLRRDGIDYHWVRRSPSHRLAVKLLESGRALYEAVRAALARGPQLIHARAHVAATIGLVVRALAPRARFLFDCRGLVGDEYVEWGHWSRSSPEYRLLKAAEKQLFRRADGLVVLTDRLRRWLRDETRLVGADCPIEVIPCCVDLERFRFQAQRRAAARSALGVDGELVLAYSGSLGSCYCDDEMAALFAAVRRRRPATFLVLSRSPTERLRAALRSHGVAERDVRIRPASPDEVPDLLAATDVAVSFIAPFFSKMASSPTKLAEYLAMGLPVAISDGIGDQDAVARAHPEILMSAGGLTTPEIDALAARLVALPPASDERRARARALAEQNFALATGIERYLDIYERVAG